MKKAISIGIIVLLLITGFSSLSTAKQIEAVNDNDDVDDELWEVIMDLDDYWKNVREKYEELHLDYSDDDTAMEAIATFFVELRDTYRPQIILIHYNLDEKKNSETKNDLDSAIQNFTEFKDETKDKVINLKVNDGYAYNDPRIVTLDEAANGLRTFIDKLEAISNSIRVSKNLQVFKNILLKFFDDHPNLLKQIQRLLKI